MEDSTLVLRQAISADVDQLTKLHMASFRPEEHVPVMLGERYVRATYRWLVEGKDAYALVSASGNKIAGVVGMCDIPFARPMFKACLGAFVLSLIQKPTLLFGTKLWKRLFRGSESSEIGKKIAHYPGVAQMTIGVVNAEFRGQGVFPALVEATKDFSRERGSRAIRAGVYKPNNASRRVFIKGGWIEMPELETSDTVFYMAYLDPTISAELERLASE